MATKTNEKETAARPEQTDGPLIDLARQDMKKFIAKAKERGYVTYDELNQALPQDQVSSEQIEDIMAMLSEMGINVIESEEQDENQDEAKQEVAASGNSSGDVERTDDPVRMYLREMGSVELLSREGEIAIAKRIEAGREQMIGGLCESPLTMRMLIEWRDEIVAGNMLLRDVIDLESTYGKPEGIENSEDDDGDDANGTAAPESGDAAGAPAAARSSGDDSGDEEAAPRPAEDDDEDFDENALSLAAMEAALKPRMLEAFEEIAKLFKRVERAQDKRVSMAFSGDEMSTASRLSMKPNMAGAEGPKNSPSSLTKVRTAGPTMTW